MHSVSVFLVAVGEAGSPGLPWRAQRLSLLFTGAHCFRQECSSCRQFEGSEGCADRKERGLSLRHQEQRGVQIYEALQESSLWRRYKGADFIFYLPFHLNLVSEYQAAISDRDSLHHFLHLICGPLKASLQITSENLQVSLEDIQSHAPNL